MSKEVITIHQPEHLPWLGFFNKIAKAEIFVILDNVPYRKNYFQNRNKIIGTNKEQWIGVPVFIKGHINGTIKDTEIATASNIKWREKYLRTIYNSYCKYDFFGDIFPRLSEIIMEDYDKLGDLNTAIIKMFAEGFKIKTQLVKASDLKVNGNKSDLILNICTELGAKRYIAGPYGREYLKREEFTEKGIEVCFNDYNHPTYTQRKTDNFIGYLSALDLVMNIGFEEGFRVLMKGNENVSWKWKNSEIEN